MSIKKNGLIVIDEKIISLQHINGLAKIAYGEYLKLASNSTYSAFKVHVKCFDKFSYDSGNVDIFNETSVLTKDRIKSIEINAVCDNALNIRLKLTHGNFTTEEQGSSEIEIGGSDFELVHDLLARFEQELKAIPNQNNFFTKTENRIGGLIIITSTIGFGVLIDLVSKGEEFYTPYWRKALVGWGEFIGLTLLAGIMGFIPGGAYFSFVTKTRDVWPNIELAIGPDHLRPEVRKKKYIVFFIISVLLPLVLALVYDILKLATIRI